MFGTRPQTAAIHVALPLLLGAASYIALRSWVPLVGAHAPLWPDAPAMLRDHFADAAWGWALGAFVAVMWRGERLAHRLLWTLAAIIVAAAVELVQSRGGWGAFDRVDLVVQTGAVVVAGVVIGGFNRWIPGNEVA
jgi:hypothetical protein